MPWHEGRREWTGDLARWTPFGRPKPAAPLRLLCFPYAGGGASAYYSWIGQLGPNIDVVPIQLPGKETRLGETSPSAIMPLVELLATNLRPILDWPYALYGHSMGGLIAFELARWLRTLGAPDPRHLFVGGRRAPQMEDASPPIHQLPEAELLAELRRLDGTPAEVLEDRALMRLLLPGLRTDFALCETYTYRAGTPLNCPVSSFGGLDDPDVQREHLEGWREQTSAHLTVHQLPGGHFFLHTARPMLLALLREEVEPTLANLSMAPPSTVSPERR